MQYRIVIISARLWWWWFLPSTFISLILVPSSSSSEELKHGVAILDHSPSVFNIIPTDRPLVSTMAVVNTLVRSHAAVFHDDALILSG